jgi:hypothetical protein
MPLPRPLRTSALRHVPAVARSFRPKRRVLTGVRRGLLWQLGTTASPSALSFPRWMSAMIADPHDHIHPARENEWASHLIAVVAAIIIVAGVVFALNSMSKEYEMAAVKAPPASIDVQLANPADMPAQTPPQ